MFELHIISHRLQLNRIIKLYNIKYVYLLIEDYSELFKILGENNVLFIIKKIN